MLHKDPAGLEAFPGHCTGGCWEVCGTWLACSSPSTPPGDSAILLGPQYRQLPWCRDFELSQGNNLLKKDTSPIEVGAKATENPPGIAGDMSRSCHPTQ